jgi:hypothetical protein
MRECVWKNHAAVRSFRQIGIVWTEMHMLVGIGLLAVLARLSYCAPPCTALCFTGTLLMSSGYSSLPDLPARREDIAVRWHPPCALLAAWLALLILLA